MSLEERGFKIVPTSPPVKSAENRKTGKSGLRTIVLHVPSGASGESDEVEILTEHVIAVRAINGSGEHGPKAHVACHGGVQYAVLETKNAILAAI